MRSAGIYAGVFLAGAVMAFAYSYAPLHSAKDWKIGYLEERLRAKNDQIGDFEKKLVQARGEATRRADPEAFRQLQNELARTDATAAELERKLARVRRRAKDLERSRDGWKARHAEAESKLEALAAAGENAPTAADAAIRALPAAPAPTGGESLAPLRETVE